MGLRDIFSHKTKIKSNSDDYYKIDPFDGTPFSRPVVVYDDAIKKSWKTPTGLYPPEVVAIYFCNIHPNPKTGYPAWYWFKYGIRDVAIFQKQLEAKGLIEKASDGKWTPSEKGEQELRDNEFIVWAHRHPDIAGVNAWTIGEILDNTPKNMKKYSWRDKLWWYMNDYCIHEKNAGLKRNMMFQMAQFLYDDDKNVDAVKLLDRVIQLDEESGDFEAYDGSPLLEKREKWQSKIKS